MAALRRPLAWTVGLAYPVFDLVLITLALVVVIHTRASVRSGLGLLTIGLICLCTADSGLAYVTATGHYATGNGGRDGQPATRQRQGRNRGRVHRQDRAALHPRRVGAGRGRR